MDCIPFGCTTSSCVASSSSSKANKRNNNKEKKNGVKKNKQGVKLSTDPQSVAARERRHRISDRFKILQSMVPGGSKMDTVSMLEEAIHYVKFLKTQIWLHQTMMMNFGENHESSPSSSMFLVPDHQCYLPSEQINVPLLQNPSVESTLLPQLPLPHGTTFDDTLKHWPA